MSIDSDDIEAVPEAIERDRTKRHPEVVHHRLTEAEKALKLGAQRFSDIEHKISLEVNAVQAKVDEKLKEMGAAIAQLQPKPIPPLKLWGAVGGLVIFLATILYAAGELRTSIRYEMQMLREDINELRDQVKRPPATVQ